MKTLRLGKGLTFPAHAITETFAVLGVRGSGKSNAAAVMAEAMFRAELPFCVIDPVGSWWGLRSSRDGKGPGLEIPIFGGPKGDVPLERRGGELIADLIVDERLSCILDLRQLESEGGKKEFLLGFARRLYNRNEAPLHLFLEEADDYIPQRPMGNEEKFLKRAFENIVRRGRGRGLGMTMITQRSAVLNKDVLTQAGTLIAFRTTGPRDRDAVLEWVKYHDQDKEIAASLPGLRDGECWIWSPEFLADTFQARFRLRNTFDSGQTPRMLKAMKRPARLADVDLDAVEQKMAATIERAKAEDPKALKREVTELRREIENLRRQKPTIQVEKATVRKEVKVPMLGARDRKLLQKVLGAIGRSDDLLDTVAEKLQKVLDDRQEIRGSEAKVHLMRQGKRRKENLPPVTRELSASEAKRRANAINRASDNGRLNLGERAILTVLVQYPDGAEQNQIAVLTGYRQTSRVTYLKQLRAKGYAEQHGKTFVATAAGRAALGDVEPLPTGKALQDYWLNRLSPGERKILDALLQSYPQSLTYEDIQQATDYKATSVITYLKQLRARRIVESGRGTAQASDILFD